MTVRNPRRRAARAARLRRRMESIGLVFRGSLAEVSLTCGKPNCRCARGERHRALYGSYRCGGKTRVVHIPRALVGEARQAGRNWRRLKRLLEQLAEALAQQWKEASHGRKEEARKESVSRSGGTATGRQARRLRR